MNVLLDFSVRSACDNWSASAVCFFSVLWRYEQFMGPSWRHGLPVVSCVRLSNLVVLDEDLCMVLICHPSECFKPLLKVYFCHESIIISAKRAKL